MKFKKIIGFALAAMLAIPAIAAVSKEAKADNPIVQNIFAPDPAPMVYDDTVYLYTTHDEDQTVGGFYTMLNWHCFSTKDMVNYTSHGQIWSLDDISWANDRAWAAQCVERDGLFYLYVPVKAADAGICIGVGVSDNPAGPFEDALGRPLIDEGDWNDIDPTVYIDDDGQAYLYFGNPQLRYVKLNDDMISVDTTASEDNNVKVQNKSYKTATTSGPVCTLANRIEMTTEAFGKGKSDDSASYAEGPWFYKKNDQYYMVYPAFGASGGENISYSTADSPTGPWYFGGVILSPNNCYTIHPGVIDYHDRTFLFYHGNSLDKTSSFHRSCAVEEVIYGEDGSIPAIDQTEEGPDPVQNLNPYNRVEAETMAWEAGVEVKRVDGYNCHLYSLHDGNYVKLKSVDFGKNAPIGINANVALGNASKGGTIEFRIDCKEDINSTTSKNDSNIFGEKFDLHNTDVESGELIATVDVDKVTGGDDVFETIKGTIEKEVTGVHDLFIVFRSDSDDEMFRFDYWQFDGVPEPTAAPTQDPAVQPTQAPAVQPSQAPAVSDNKVKVSKITVNKKKVTLKVKKSFKIKIKIKPANATNKKVTYKSSNKKVAKVSSKGIIKALKKGKAVITVTAKDGSKKVAKITVKVK